MLGNRTVLGPYGVHVVPTAKHPQNAFQAMGK